MTTSLDPTAPSRSLDGPLGAGNAVGRATRELLIITAEQLFAEQGTSGVSLREIGQAAGQRNNGAAQYHFGSREKLIEAIHEYRAEQIDLRRWTLLERLEADPSPHDTAALLRAMFFPHIENMFDPQNHFLGFLARRLADEGTLTNSSDKTSRHMGAHRRFVALIQAQITEVDARIFRRRFQVVIAWAIQSLAIIEHTEGAHSAKRVAIKFDELVGMLAAALRAP